MKIAMATEYYWPYDLGGSEWSTHYLARGLIKAGHKVLVVTPKYGSYKSEIKDKINILRFPFPKKIKKNHPLSPFWHTNILWILLTTYHLIKICKEENVDVLHLQGKYYSPAGYFVKKFLGIPVILTVRDYQLICNYGFCIWQNSKSCSLKSYFKDDFTKYYKSYVIKKNFVALIFNLIYALRGRATRNIYKYFATHLDKVVCISQAQAKIYRSNNFKNTSVIYNSTEFKISSTKPKNKIVYAGRLTPGKGVELLIEAIPVVFSKYPNLNLEIFGDGFLKNELEKMSKRYTRGKIKLAGQISHRKLLDEFANSLAVVVPSIWPEPFGRVALEAISQGTPVVTTGAGGLAEIVEDGKTGYVCNQTATALSRSIIKAIQNNSNLRLEIRKSLPKLKKKFQDNTIKQYLKVYK